MKQREDLPEVYRGPGKWTNALNESSTWGGIASIPAILTVLSPMIKVISSAVKTGINPTIDMMDKAAEKVRGRFWPAVAFVFGVQAVAAYFGYKKVETAENDYNKAVGLVKDLTLENDKLTAEKKWSDREAERRDALPKEKSI